MNSKHAKGIGWAGVTFVEVKVSARPNSARRDAAVSRAGPDSAFGRYLDDGADLIGAIAAELLRLRGGSVQQQLRLARQLLESAFGSIEAGGR